MKILILGASGMLGHAMLGCLSEQTDWHVFGTVRTNEKKRFFDSNIRKRLVTGIDVGQFDSLMQAFIDEEPDIVINCIGIVKQLAIADDPLFSIPINSQLPHRLARICELAGSRLIHISTDCVFSGKKGGYVESDPADAQDLYGRTKALGEVDYPHAITLRTSIIGHELLTRHGLVEWFLSQQDVCNGYSRAIFSGFPTVVLAKIIREYIIPSSEMRGVYHVASKPVSKYKLLKLIAKTYGKKISILPDDTVVIDRSLDATRFNQATGYVAPEWESMIELMHRHQ